MNQRSDARGWLITFLVASILICGGYKLDKKYRNPPTMPVPRTEVIPLPPPPKVPATPNISVAVPTFMHYPEIQVQLQKWNQEAPDLTEVGTYGQSRQGKQLSYIRVTNKFDNTPKPVVLIHGCIHGNEPHATTIVMALIGTLLSNYNKDQEVTALINARDIYFVPVMCVDSYPNSRQIDGVDPNRDYPCPSRPNRISTPCVKAMQDFFLRIKPRAAMSCHTHGRVFLCPWGDQMQTCPNWTDYQRVVGKMAQLCQYRIDRACNMYSRPIHGGELDWYYRHGAFSCVMEIGTHQHPPSMQEIQSEFQRTYKGLLYFIQEAPMVSITPVSFTTTDEWLAREKMKVPIPCTVGMSD